MKDIKKILDKLTTYSPYPNGMTVGGGNLVDKRDVLEAIGVRQEDSMDSKEVDKYQ